jgi:cyclophilin family peptidyl-prolyl cis-trans isomerase
MKSIWANFLKVNFLNGNPSHRAFEKPLIAILCAILPLASCSRNADVPDRPGLYAVIETDKGDLTVELFPASAPKTVENFLKLTEKGFYDGILFHRVIKNFMAQTGDPEGTGAGGPGYRFEDEISAKALGLDTKLLRDAPEYHSHIGKAIALKFAIRSEEEWNRISKRIEAEAARMMNRPVVELLRLLGYAYNDSLPSKSALRGAIAMANAGPNTNGSQFFINQVDTPHLNGLHTVFGELIASYEVLDRIIDAGNGNSRIKKIRIIDRRGE